ncbi:tryptophan synthase subunit alpha [Actinoplanes sp. SE50]|uniref:tryptophan synthase subunit alpha n=1 Tax=unclassified Actinoplanes TaxID=2626549 RepID=UPI00023ED418|nr:MULTISPECIES: tryptophan synthase subunit alpha [unclassified Actinoplanes]AEV83917.1 tryptophan synthase subunit alpha [Actinoplanes sp. SE50/110]ATO81939.1 tryptophan synthase subunit alpha [Actinoplanes sp. SE50]SLL99347.1 tryptophan synthase subunit alpha [Actinoplanes sp. SE50/110]
MKRLNPYLTGGITPDWIDYLLAFQDAGADAVEIGLPFSDPMVDGATIQRASDQALRRGATAASILSDLTAARHRIRIPLIAMTYANLVFRGDPQAGEPTRQAGEPTREGGKDTSRANQPVRGSQATARCGEPTDSGAGATIRGDGPLSGGGDTGGPEAFCRRLAEAGFSGLIVPDVPVDEADRLERAAAAAGIDLVLLAAPVTPEDRLTEIGRRSRGFVYAVSVMNTTGERDTLAATAAPLAARLKAVTDLPVLIGFGISTPAQAATAARAGDGVVIGAALMRRVLDGASPDDLRAEVAAYRAALDQVDQEMPVARAHAEISGDRR